jgi:hypothetical protein
MRARTQAPASGLALGWKHQAASHRCSVTWMRSQMMVTVMPRAAAWARIWRIWSLFPSASAIHLASCAGSRRSASANIAATTCAVVAVTLAVSHLCRAAGPGGRGPGPVMSAGVRGAGSIAQTAPAAAIRLRVRTSPWDSRPSCFGTALRAARSARGRSCPGRIRIPLASHDSTSTCPGPGAGRGQAA